MKNFLQNQDLQIELQRKIDAARRSIEKLELRGAHTHGDSYFFHESNHLPVRWVAVVQHVDNPALWYLVAADEYPDIGTCDIELPPDHAWAPMALRCGIGFWADQRDLTLKNYAGRLEPEAVDDAQLRLSEMVHGTVAMDPPGLTVDEDPGYSNWIEELSSVAESIEARLQTDPVVVLAPSDSKSWVQEVLSRSREVGNQWVSHLGTLVSQGSDPEFQPSLAAAPAGHSGPASAIPDGRKIGSSLKGALVLLKDSEEYELVFYPDQSQSESLPPVMTAGSNESRDHKWVCGPDHVYHWTKPLKRSDENGMIEFDIGRERFSVEAF